MWQIEIQVGTAGAMLVVIRAIFQVIVNFLGIVVSDNLRFGHVVTVASTFVLKYVIL